MDTWTVPRTQSDTQRVPCTHGQSHAQTVRHTESHVHTDMDKWTVPPDSQTHRESHAHMDRWTVPPDSQTHSHVHIRTVPPTDTHTQPTHLSPWWKRNGSESGLLPGAGALGITTVFWGITPPPPHILYHPWPVHLS
ncbi:rho guanine nucleotide exchange factor 9 [Platysternon megacephalum]|uniref:Rho guanine nucleotide exchange factor 9 n=1 Tax=Platysternon megacephalum TaxID=55544 RepID=A0A4D9DPC7_9SAUR|nr:rho guanine nucleotide exchange factor 9 [Platysternon megacephalum]